MIDFQTFHQLYYPSLDMLNGNIQLGHKLSRKEATGKFLKTLYSRPREKLEEIQVTYCENCGTAELRDFISGLALECFQTVGHDFYIICQKSTGFLHS